MLFDLQRFAVIYNETVLGGIDFNSGETNVVGTADADSITNEVNYATITAAAGNDTIENSAAYAVIFGDADTDVIENVGSNVLIDGGADKDGIINSGSDSTLRGGDGGDIIINTGMYVLVLGGDGDDTIQNYADAYTGQGFYSTLVGGAGNDTVDFRAPIAPNYYRYFVGDGNDVLLNYNSNVVIALPDDATYSSAIDNHDTVHDAVLTLGDNTIRIVDAAGTALNISGGQLVTVDSEIGDFDDYNHITNSTASVEVNGTDGNDFIENFARHVTINAGGGNDFIASSVPADEALISNGLTLNAGDGDDTIIAYAEYGSIDGGAGNDSIIAPNAANYSNLSIRGGAGDDTIMIRDVGGNYIYQYGGDDGDDIIINHSGYGALQIIDDSAYATMAVNNNLLVTVGGSTIVFMNAANVGLNIAGGHVLDTLDPHNVTNTTNFTVVSGTSDADTIRNYGDNSTVRAGGGNDVIISIGEEVIVDGGAGDDSIDIDGYANIVDFAADGGSDVVYGFGEDDSIDITDYGAYSTVGDGDDVLVKRGDATMRLIGMSGKALNVSGGDYVEDSGGGSNDGNDLPTGLTKFDQTIEVSSEYDGGVWLTGFDILNWRECYADASAIEVNATSGRVIVGNEQSNMLRAGVNGAWLWGYLGDDTLVGGAGEDMFWFGKGEGDDVIDGCDDDDLINLWSVSLMEIASFDVDDDNNISVGITDGGSIKINTTGVDDVSIDRRRALEIRSRQPIIQLRAIVIATSLRTGLRLSRCGSSFFVVKCRAQRSFRGEAFEVRLPHAFRVRRLRRRLGAGIFRRGGSTRA